MKKKMNIIFFGVCFLAALLAEAYCLQVLEGELISTVGLGLVVLITGYLLMDTIRSNIKLRSENLQFYVDRILREETEKWNERYTEILNLQKATYTATKKNTAMLSGHVAEILHVMEDMENNNVNEVQKIIELQKRSMEGQKNALNMEIHYNKENTKQLVEVLREEGNRNDVKEQLSKVLELLEANNELLNKHMSKIGDMNFSNPQKEVEEPKLLNQDDFKGLFDSDLMFDETSNQSIDSTSLEEEQQNNEEINNEEINNEEINNDDVNETVNGTGAFDEKLYEEDSFADSLSEVAITDEKQEEVDKENASEHFNTFQEEAEPEAGESVQEEVANKDVVPLYSDPNKALTADEIAALFASFGQ